MTEEQKQRARENARRYYYAHKEEVLRKQNEYRKKKYETDEEYRNKVKKRWKHFSEVFKEQHPEYNKDYNREWSKRKRNSYKTRCEKAIEYNEKIYKTCSGDEKLTARINLEILRGER